MLFLDALVVTSLMLVLAMATAMATSAAFA